MAAAEPQADRNYKRYPPSPRGHNLSWTKPLRGKPRGALLAPSESPDCRLIALVRFSEHASFVAPELRAPRTEEAHHGRAT
jgi:hypothetical protein